jgi:hypothetical protein
VVWPVLGFWTSIDDPVMVAMMPDAPGNERPAPGAPDPDPDPDRGLVDEVEEAADEPPHAARVTAATPKTAKASLRRVPPETRRATRPARSAGRDDGLVSMVIVFP